MKNLYGLAAVFGEFTSQEASSCKNHWKGVQLAPLGRYEVSYDPRVRIPAYTGTKGSTSVWTKVQY